MKNKKSDKKISIDGLKEIKNLKVYVSKGMQIKFWFRPQEVDVIRNLQEMTRMSLSSCAELYLVETYSLRRNPSFLIRNPIEFANKIMRKRLIVV